MYVVADIEEGCSVVNVLMVVDDLTLSEVGCWWEAVKNNGILVGGRIITLAPAGFPISMCCNPFGELPPPPFKPTILPTFMPSPQRP